ncbi:MAG: TerC family protein [Flavobacteriales bacterium]|nr:TerC family protein [Flavobacteriales bacterium]
MEDLLTLNALLSFVTLALLEIVLGIDNVIFVSIILGRMPEQDRARGRKLWMIIGILMRTGLLLGLTTLVKHGDKPLFAVAGNDFTLRHIILFAGGMFLLYKAVMEIHAKVEGGEHQAGTNAKAKGFAALMAQIIVVDAVFSFDSILTAIGLGNHVEVMVAAVVVAMFVMFFFAHGISTFIEKHPTLKMLALSFLVMVGFMLFFEGLEPLHHSEIPKGYAYVAMAFSFAVELLNMRVRGRQVVKLNK